MLKNYLYPEPEPSTSAKRPTPPTTSIESTPTSQSSGEAHDESAKDSSFHIDSNEEISEGETTDTASSEMPVIGKLPKFLIVETRELVKTFMTKCHTCSSSEVTVDAYMVSFMTWY